MVPKAVPVLSGAAAMTTLWCGTFAILAPLGVSRGIVASAIQAVETSERRLSELLQSQDQPQGGEDRDSSSQVLTKDVVEQYLTMGGGYRGQLFRTVAGPFFPSTAQMLVRIQQTIDAQERDQQPPQRSRHHRDYQIVASAVVGYIEGFLQDKKDTMTMIGCALYALLVGAGYGMDCAIRAARNKRTELRGTSDVTVVVDQTTLQQPETPQAQPPSSSTWWNYYQMAVQSTRDSVMGKKPNVAKEETETTTDDTVADRDDPK
jgi:hypothetical protein